MGVDIDALDIGKLSDQELAELQEKTEYEKYVRYAIGTAAEQIANVIRAYAAAGGNMETLAAEVEDALPTRSE